MTTLVCTSCEVAIPTAARTEHYGSEWHKYNVKRRCAGLSHIPRELFTQKLEALKSMQDDEQAAKTTQKCTICNKSFSGAAYQQHLSSKRHLSRAMKKSSRKPSTQSSLNDVDDLNDAVEDLSLAENTVQESKSTPQQHGEDGEEGEGDEGDYQFDESKIIPTGTCYFCNKNCRTVKKALTHMLKKHGFFVPFIEYLTDLDGLIEYFGAKVGVGRVCLYCNKVCSSLQGVQQHMRDTSHCKIRMQGDENDDDEFLEFYKFPKKDLPPWARDEEGEGDEDVEGEGDQETKMEDEGEDETTLTVAPKRRLAGMNDAGELIMTDGAIIGHRSLNKAYRQNVRPTTRQEELLEMMGNSYRRLQLDGYDTNRKSKFNEVQHKYQQRHHREQLKYQFRANNIARFVDATLS